MSTLSQALRVKHLAEVEATVPASGCTAREAWLRLDKWAPITVRKNLDQLATEGRLIRETGPASFYVYRRVDATRPGSRSR